MTKEKKNIGKKSQRSIKFGVAKTILLVLIAVALLAPFIANERPLYIKYKNHSFFPAFSLKNSYSVKDEVTGLTEILQIDITDWKHLNAETVIFPPVVYSPGKKDLLNAGYVSPSGTELFLDDRNNVVEIPAKYRHWFGTNKRGEDVLAGLIHGTRVSLMVGFFSMGLAGFIGILLGCIAGYFGDFKLRTTRGRFWTFMIGLVIAWFYAFHARYFVLVDSLTQSGWSFFIALITSILIAIAIGAAFSFIGKLIGKVPFLRRKIFIHADSIISRAIEVLISLPRLIIIISIAAIARPSLLNLIIIIGLTSWTGIARLVRAEMLKVREMDYVTASRALGFKEFRIMIKHSLPNAVSPAMVALAFGVASAILVESSLSFLGVGVPPEIVSWGSMLAEGREYFNAWWLVVFPGFAIFLVVGAFNLLGDVVRDRLDKMNR